jgi:hypothetical protein
VRAPRGGPPRRRFAADDDLPRLVGHRQVPDAHLLALARRHGTRVATFDAGLRALGGDDVALLRAR